MKQVFGQRFLVIYSGVLTAVFAVAVLGGFVAAPKKTTLQELDVQRINVVEPDGTLRMVISDKARFPGAIVRGKEYPHERPTAGMLFYDDEGSETGGLTFAGYKDKDGKVRSAVHLSFDRYMQDQVLTLDAADNPDGSHQAGLELIDRPDYPITELIDLMMRTRDQPKAQQEAAIRTFRASHPEPHRRLVMARQPDGSVMLGLNDAQGHPRIVLKVGSDGTPSIQMLDADGKPVGGAGPQAAR
ncbi:MAG TPA: hypothetical protein VJR95_07030 [Rhodanobacter sp.]|nr:hypothetical protein [Rhodanobacter sp.]